MSPDGAYCAFLVHKYPIYRCSGVLCSLSKPRQTDRQTVGYPTICLTDRDRHVGLYGHIMIQIPKKKTLGYIKLLLNSLFKDYTIVTEQ